MARRPNYAFERKRRAEAKAEKREAKRRAKREAKLGDKEVTRDDITGPIDTPRTKTDGEEHGT